MRKLLITIATAASALAVAAPASAQYLPQPRGYAYGYNNYGHVRALQCRGGPEGEDDVPRLHQCGHDRTSRASASRRAPVRSIHRRSASRWNSPWSARRASTRRPVRLSSVSSRIRCRCAARWVSR